ncbi:GmrSD restriction endonuclease domain-containing protein [Streptomyces prasinus]
MADLEDSGGGPVTGGSRPTGPRGYAVPEDIDRGSDAFFLPLGPALEIGADGRPTGVELELPSDEEDEEEGPYRDADGISAPFRPDSIKIHTETTTVDLLLSRLREGMIDLAPDFQRRAGIWSDRAQSRLIESLLLRIPISNFHMAQDDEDKWAVVDGVQRLTAIARFMEPRLTGLGPLTLRGLDYLGNFDGSTYQDLTGRLKIRLRETQLTVHIMQQGTPEAVKHNVFSRINTTGMPLTQQELRHALVRGPVREFLADLAEDPSFGEATRWSVSNERMADREMVLRFLAFRLSNPAEHTEKDFDGFLTAAMYRVNNLSEERRAQLTREFRVAMRCAKELFGEHAFRKWHGGKSSSPVINKALFETISVHLALLDDHERDRLVAFPARVHDGFFALMDDWDFDRSISIGTGTPARIRTRFQYMARLFRGVAEQ